MRQFLRTLLHVIFDPAQDRSQQRVLVEICRKGYRPFTEAALAALLLNYSTCIIIYYFSQESVKCITVYRPVNMIDCRLVFINITQKFNEGLLP